MRRYGIDVLKSFYVQGSNEAQKRNDKSSKYFGWNWVVANFWHPDLELEAGWGCNVFNCLTNTSFSPFSCTAIFFEEQPLVGHFRIFARGGRSCTYISTARLLPGGKLSVKIMHRTYEPIVSKTYVTTCTFVRTFIWNICGSLSHQFFGLQSRQKAMI